MTAPMHKSTASVMPLHHFPSTILLARAAITSSSVGLSGVAIHTLELHDTRRRPSTADTSPSHLQRIPDACRAGLLHALRRPTTYGRAVLPPQRAEYSCCPSSPRSGRHPGRRGRQRRPSPSTRLRSASDIQYNDEEYAGRLTILRPGHKVQRLALFFCEEAVVRPEPRAVLRVGPWVIRKTAKALVAADCGQVPPVGVNDVEDALDVR